MNTKNVISLSMNTMYEIAPICLNSDVSIKANLKAIEINPQNATAYYNLGRLYQNKNQFR